MRDADDGSGSVLALGALGVVLSALVTSLVVSGALRAAHQARGAADLAALAAAQESSVGATPTHACAIARHLAERNSARLVSCSVASGSVVTVDTAVPLPFRPEGFVPEMTGRARAGPAPDD